MKASLILFVLLFTTCINSFGEFNHSDNPLAMSDTTHIPIDLNDCITQLDRIIPDSSKSQISAMTEEQFSARSHFGLGIWMRNNWRLWNGSRLAKFFNSKGIYHPDDMSGIILDSYYRYLTKQDIKLDEQIRHYQDYWERLKRQEFEREKKEFSDYHISDTVLFRYENGFSSRKQEHKYDDRRCTAKGIITDRNEEKLIIKVKLLEDCDKRGIVSYDNEGSYILDTTTGKMEKPKKRIRMYMTAGEENWFRYRDWETN